MAPLWPGSVASTHIAQTLLIHPTVTRESKRLNGIITDFLAYSRTKQYHFDKVDLPDEKFTVCCRDCILPTAYRLLY